MKRKTIFQSTEIAHDVIANGETGDTGLAISASIKTPAARATALADFVVGGQLTKVHAIGGMILQLMNDGVVEHGGVDVVQGHLSKKFGAAMKVIVADMQNGQALNTVKKAFAVAMILQHGNSDFQKLYTDKRGDYELTLAANAHWKGKAHSAETLGKVFDKVSKAQKEKAAGSAGKVTNATGKKGGPDKSDAAKRLEVVTADNAQLAQVAKNAGKAAVTQRAAFITALDDLSDTMGNATLTDTLRVSAVHEWIETVRQTLGDVDAE